MTDIINIVLASDNNYAQHLAVTAVSILENTGKPKSICFYVLSDGIDDDNYCLIQKTICNYGASVTKIECATNDGFYTEGHITKAAYLRLNIANVLPLNVNKVIYLDDDLLVLQDIEELWNVDLQGKPVAAVPDLALMCSKRMMEQKRQTLGLCNDDLYFNSGVMVIDVQQWRDLNYSEKVVAAARDNNFRHQDQDALNLVFKNNWLPLDFKWNVIPPIWAMQLKIYFSEFRSEAVIAHNNPAIFHYAGRYKPWEFEIRQGFNDKYYEYFAKTEFKNKKMPQPGNMQGKSLLRQMLRIKFGNWLCR